MENITVTEAKQQLDQNETVVMLDVREPWEYEICHIKGSIHIPMSEIVDKTEQLDTDAKIIVISSDSKKN